MFGIVPVFVRWGLAALFPAALIAVTGAPIPVGDAAATVSRAESPQDWDVENPPGSSFEIAIDTDEGTWMSLDVSPGGDEIVFDLLGDLYTIPIGGGEATPLTSGLAWDMQPRFSPDGRSIAFSSDRGGADNIWIIDRDGSSPRQVTREDYRLPNSPAWTPDGEYIAVRKHFTSRRSLGAGEIWLYHRSGGDGLQMVERPNDQKDLGEPAFSPDGRYLYYSQDTTPGARFEYNKDPNTEIYVIKRLDRDSGEILPFVTGPGGAVRPTPSPDGRRLAFVRRVRTKTVLFLQEIDSGREWPLYDGLERDMQETWAIHGVYPTMAWTPDSGSIVFWAGGKIRRVDAETGEVSIIPFRVRTTRRMTPALRFPVDVAPDRFDVKMLRWMQVSPDGGSVVYQALGHLYIRDLPDGEPRRLTRQTDHFEFFPSFSRDGRRIVYTTWNDDAFGTIRIAPARGGDGRVITGRPGHFLEPVFSPDGTRIVYRRGDAGDLTSRQWSRDTGLFWISAQGGEPHRIRRRGRQPHFGAGNDRVFFMTIDDPEESSEHLRSLRSIELDGSDERVWMESEAALGFRVSPDERWVAFIERFNAFITPFASTGRTVTTGPKTEAMPVVRVSRDAGEYLHWSGDGRRLHWGLGNELFGRDLNRAFAFLEGAPAELPEPESAGRPIGFTATTDRPEGTIALVGARLITMRGDEVIEDGIVIVEENRIGAVGAAAEIRIPDDATVIDVTGTTILPGFIDVHAHFDTGWREVMPQRNWQLFANLAFGVTTVHDPSHDTSEVFAAAEAARAGLITSPRLFSTGTILYGASGPAYRAELDSLEDARTHLRRMKAVGAFSVKSYNQPRRSQRQQVIAAARELEMMVVPEGGSLFQHNMNMVVDGHTGIEHSIPVANLYSDALTLWANSEVWYTPTLVVGYGGLWGENYWYQHDDVWANDRLMAFTPRFVVDPRARRRIKAPDDEFNHINNARICRQLVDAGGHVLLGSHGQLQGLAAHWELWMLVQGGMTPMQALRAATIDGAAYLGLDGDLGSLQPGKLADLIVIDGNPLAGIRDTERIRFTMINGRLFEARTMDEVGNHPRKRAKFFWE